MEVHIELATRTKMFSRALSPAFHGQEDAEPNTYIDPTVLGLPGAMPVMNGRAVELSVLVGLALGCEIPPRSVWDRKNYFYPDLPKAYQISQYQLPLCAGGAIDVPETDDAGFPDFSRPPTRIRIIRAHLEEDAGKLQHEVVGGLETSTADYNRAGTPLLEIVTAPDFSSADQCVMFARSLRNICRYLGATLGVMQKGHMRFEPNINMELVLDDGRTVRTPIVEVKNLNSFKSLRGAIEHELREQPSRYVKDRREMGPGAKTTRGWDDVTERTFVQREKEDAHDYRYFPDPDLLPLIIDRQWVEQIRAQMPELPTARRERLIAEWGLSPYDAKVLTSSLELANYFEATLAIAGMADAKSCANWVMGDLTARLNKEDLEITQSPVAAAQLGGLIARIADGTLSTNMAKKVFNALWIGEGGSADEIIQSQGLRQISDSGSLATLIDELLAANPSMVTEFRAGKEKAFNALVGQVMKATRGQANPQRVSELLRQKLG